jgi:hypothetical protein
MQEGSLDVSLQERRLDVLRRLRERAAGIGCDAILVLGPADTVEGCSGITISAKSERAVTKKGYRASCIAYRDSTPVNSPDFRTEARGQ